jgi:uncharacterized SAM-binding protein YcdF (DUF218 family)
MPITWVLVLLVWRYFSRSPRLKRRLGIAAIIVLIVFSNQWIYDQANLCWQPASQQASALPDHEVGILLTGMIQFDKTNQGFFGASSDRFIQTNRLYHMGKIKKILITGGSSGVLHDYPPEASFLAQQFMEAGVPPANIIIEPNSRNTYENAIFSKRMIDSMQLKGPFLLITSAQHMRRSVAVFRKAGLRFDTYPADFQVTNQYFSFDDLLPNPRILSYWTNLIKEVVGLFVYRLTGKA